MAVVKVDIADLEKLGKDMHAASLLLLGRLGERGYKHLRDEVPVQMGNLKQGVAPAEIDKTGMTATLTVSARSAATGARSATVHNPSGKTKQILLRPTKAFNYAEVVAKGRPAIRPKVGKALLIPVGSAPSGESYISSGSQLFVVRRSAKATKPNPFDERAAAKLEREAPAIASALFAEFFK